MHGTSPRAGGCSWGPSAWWNAWIQFRLSSWISQWKTYLNPKPAHSFRKVFATATADARSASEPVHALPIVRTRFGLRGRFVLMSLRKFAKCSRANVWSAVRLFKSLAGTTSACTCCSSSLQDQVSLILALEMTPNSTQTRSKIYP